MEKQNKQYLQQLIAEILKIDSEEDLENFFEGLFTTSELEEIPTRLQIIKQLKQGIPQQKIAENLGVGVATVTRGSKELKLGRFRTV